MSKHEKHMTRQRLNEDKSLLFFVFTELNDHDAVLTIGDSSGQINLHVYDPSSKKDRVAYAKELTAIVTDIEDHLAELERRWP